MNDNKRFQTNGKSSILKPLTQTEKQILNSIHNDVRYIYSNRHFLLCTKHKTRASAHKTVFASTLSAFLLIFVAAFTVVKITPQHDSAWINALHYMPLQGLTTTMFWLVNRLITFPFAKVHSFMATKPFTRHTYCTQFPWKIAKWESKNKEEKDKVIFWAPRFKSSCQVKYTFCTCQCILKQAKAPTGIKFKEQWALTSSCQWR